MCRHVPSGAGKLCDIILRALLVGFHDVGRQIPDAAVSSMTHDGKPQVVSISRSMCGNCAILETDT